MSDEERRYLEYIVRQNNVLIEQISALSKVLANHLGLAIEEGEDGDIDDTWRVSK